MRLFTIAAAILIRAVVGSFTSLEPPPRLRKKAILLGGSNAGKSSLIHRFRTGRPSYEMSPTVGSKTFSFTFPVAFSAFSFNKSGNRLDLEVWDTAGQERYRSLTPAYLRSPDVAIVVYDVTSEASLTEAKYYFEEISTDSLPWETVFILVANKMDLYGGFEDAYNLREGRKYAEEREAIFLEVSAINGKGVNELFDMAAEEVVRLHFKQAAISSRLSESSLHINTDLETPAASGTSWSCCLR